MIIPGIRTSTTHCGIKKTDESDMALVVFDKPATAAGTFTTNKFKAHPVILCETHLRAKHKAQALLINSGNANAGTGEVGEKNAKEMAETVAKYLHIDPELVLVASTGIIGKPLPMDRIHTGIKTLLESLGHIDITKIAQAMMTTDTFPKTAKHRITRDGYHYHIWGIAKGAGMIAPQMATMLCFIFTDMPISQKNLAQALKYTVGKTFNNITVDGDMSTNDSVILFSLEPSEKEHYIHGEESLKIFTNELEKVAAELAAQIISDGEGTTKTIQITVHGAKRKNEAKTGALAVANSLLFKTAMFGGDANWGRIFAAIGASGIQCNPYRIDISINNIQIVQNGIGNENLKKKCDKIIKKEKDICIDIDLHAGNTKATVFTTDLTHDYVKINSLYHV